MAIPDPVWLYHITHIDNLVGIIRAGGLLANNGVALNGNSYTNIAHQSIQTRRHNKLVLCGPGGVLHDYVPFYFGPRSPMLYTIFRGNVEGYTGGQQEVIYLVTRISDIQKAGLRWVFTDGHAAMDFSDFYDDLTRLTEVDWALMNEHFWHDTNDDPDRKRRRQAEFLVYQELPWRCVVGVGTFDAIRAQQISFVLNGENPAHKPQVKTVRGWYY